MTMKKKTQKTKANVGRRNFVKLLPRTRPAGLVAAKLPLDSLAQTPSPSPTPVPSPTPAPRITKEMMRQAEKLIGIELTDAQEAMALPNVNRNLDSYETNRKTDIPLDTEPAISFHPTRAKKEFVRSQERSFALERPNCRSSRLSRTWRLPLFHNSPS